MREHILDCSCVALPPSLFFCPFNHGGECMNKRTKVLFGADVTPPMDWTFGITNMHACMHFLLYTNGSCSRSLLIIHFFLLIIKRINHWLLLLNLIVNTVIVHGVWVYSFLPHSFISITFDLVTIHTTKSLIWE